MSLELKSRLRAATLFLSAIGAFASVSFAAGSALASGLTVIPDGHYSGGGTIRGLEETWLKLDATGDLILTGDRLTVSGRVSKFGIPISPASTRNLQIVPSPGVQQFVLIDLDQARSIAPTARQVGTMQCFTGKGCIVNVSLNGGSLAASEKIFLTNDGLSIRGGKENLNGQSTQLTATFTRIGDM